MDADTPAALRAIELEEWHDTLRTLSLGEIRNAWRKYTEDGPRTKSGRLIKPFPYDIYKRAIAARPPIPKPEPVKRKEPTEVERAKVQAMVDGFVRGHKPE